MATELICPTEFSSGAMLEELGQGFQLVSSDAGRQSMLRIDDVHGLRSCKSAFLQDIALVFVFLIM